MGAACLGNAACAPLHAHAPPCRPMHPLQAHAPVGAPNPSQQSAPAEASMHAPVQTPRPPRTPSMPSSASLSAMYASHSRSRSAVVMPAVVLMTTLVVPGSSPAGAGIGAASRPSLSSLGRPSRCAACPERSSAWEEEVCVPSPGTCPPALAAGSTGQPSSRLASGSGHGCGSLLPAAW